MTSLLTRERLNFLKGLLDDQLISKAPTNAETKRKFGLDLIASNADSGSKLSIQVANRLADLLAELTGTVVATTTKKNGQTVGKEFEAACAVFVEQTFKQLEHLRPGKWTVNQVGGRAGLLLGKYDQYSHLSDLDRLSAIHDELKSFLGDGYTVSPDIVVERYPESDEELNTGIEVVDDSSTTKAVLRAKNHKNPDAPLPILHSSISCKFTMRSDRAQNTRTEALNLLRSRKGRAPHIVSVTAEPLPSRISSLALGTGDIDCVYHVALYELIQVIDEMDNEEASSLLKTMIEGKRLRDISDLPLDLAV